ncbi:MAG: A24 family peptidase [Natronospirillum sp.]|uniref:prepilin peptidase n=1 Tax=Natronospirillum sp. TaxID=2812955 RepID=UPI0025D21C6A|nr:A24 family peptidase [Natronospirillum sp.]MCH8551348.1 A24 family peptidase [Natronospirillum sp.]
MADFAAILTAFPALHLVSATLLGLLVGSFLNVVILRLPVMLERQWQSEASAVLGQEGPEPATEPFNLAVPRSRCPQCGHTIRWYENIPCLSWLWLRGRCSQCGTGISPRYPMVEALTGAFSLAVALTLQPGLETLVWLAFFWALIALTFIDLDTQLLPDQITLPLLWAGLLASLLGLTGTGLQDSVIGAMAGYLSLWSVYHGFRLLTGKEGMGYGDFKLFAVFGAWFGWSALPMIILLASLVGALAGGLMILLAGRDRQIPIAFGPYLCAAACVYYFWGEQLVSAYLNWAMA